MQPPKTKRNPGFWSGYAWSVTGATITLLGVGTALQITRGSFGPLSDLPTRVAVLFVTGLITWVFAFISALIPFASSVAIASRFNFRSGWYYALCGILTGLLLASIYEAFEKFAREFEDEQEKGGYIGDYVNVYWLLAPAALGGAMTYWWKKGRFINTETS